MTAITIHTAEDAAVRDAQSLPDLVTKLGAVNPVLAASLTGKALIASRTPWGTILLPIIAWVAARYGFGWSPDIDALVAGVAVLVGSYAMRLFTASPITSWFHKPVPVAAAAPALALVLLLVGCGAVGPVQAAATATVSQAQTQLRAAITLYGISRGIVEVASVADPGLAPVLAGVTASLDPMVARAKVALDAAELDAAAIEALAATITAQANALTLAAAPVIKVVPSVS